MFALCFQLATALPLTMWHFTTPSSIGPYATLAPGTQISSRGTLLLNTSQQTYATVSTSIQWQGGDSTFAVRYLPIITPASSGIFDFGSGGSEIRLLYSTFPGALQVTMGAKSMICYNISTLNQWATVTLTIAGMLGTLYMNAIPVCNGTLVAPQNAGTLYIGKANPSGYWTGEIDFMWFIPRALSTTEVTWATADMELRSIGWIFQSPVAVPPGLTLVGSPDLTSSTLRLTGNTSQYASIQPFLLGGSGTFAARLKLEVYQSWAKILSFSGNGTDAIVLGAVGTTDQVQFSVGRNVSAQSISCPSMLEPGQWVDVMAVASSTSFTLYKDGLLLCASSGWQPLPVTRNQMWIGRSNSVSDLGFNGEIDWVMYWPRALSSTEGSYFTVTRDLIDPIWLLDFDFVTGIKYPFTQSGLQNNNNPGLGSFSTPSTYATVDPSLSVSSTFTFSVVLKTSPPQANQRILDFSNGSTSANAIQFSQSGSAQAVQLSIFQGTVEQKLVCSIPGFAPSTNYFLLTVTHDGSTAKIHKDGVLLCSQTMWTVVPMNRNYQYIGKSNWCSNCDFNGFMDSIAYYNQALTATQVSMLRLAQDMERSTCIAAAPSNPRLNTGSCVQNGRVGTVCALGCNPPFTAFNNIQGTCYIINYAERPVWTSQAVTCIAVCPALTAPMFGSMDCSTNQENGTCAFECNPGFVLNGTSTTTCQSTALWSQKPPVCQPVTCPDLTLPFGGIVCDGQFGNFKLNSTCRFGCNDGSTIFGPFSTQCTAAGTWTQLAPTCQPIYCPALNFSSGTLQCVPGSFGLQNTYGSICSFSCPDPLSVFGASSVQCDNQGSWSDSVPNCQIGICNSLSPPANGTIMCTNGYNRPYGVSSNCSFACHAGYALTGSANAICLKTITWSAAVPACNDIDECLSFPCASGACVNLPGSFLCGPFFIGPVVSASTGNALLSAPTNQRITFQMKSGDAVLAVNSITFNRTSTSSAPCVNINITNGPGNAVTVNCTISSGVGVIALTVPYTFAGVSSVLISPTLRFPVPTISSGTLRIFGQAGATKVLGGNYENGDTMSFDGTGFLPDPSVFWVTYGPLASLCTLVIPLCNSTTITCTTQPFSTGTNMYFTIHTATDQVTGTDSYFILDVPTVLSAASAECINDTAGGAVYDCPTKGGAVLVVTANYIALTNTAGFIGGLACPLLPPITNDSSAVTNYFFNCTLPAGTGFNRTVVITSNLKYSQPATLVSYAAPTILNITGCQGFDSLTLSISNCPRQGGNTLVLTGTNFGASGSYVSVGGVRCLSTMHDSVTPHEKVNCIMPPGFSLGRQVQIFQAGGAVTQAPFTVDYLQCTAGYYQNGSSITCTRCTNGKYSNAAGSLSCTNCDPGRSASAGATSCQLCQPGYSQSSTGGSICTQCSPGLYAYSAGSAACVPCDSGTYSSGFGATFCKICGPGFVSEKINATVGPTSCDSCVPGYYVPSSQQVTCQVCPTGKFSTSSGLSMCEDCQPGFFQNQPGSTSCNPCGLGSYTNVPGRSECLPCDSGTAATTNGSTTCSFCSPGTISRRDPTLSVGPTSCFNCPEGQYIDSGGQAFCLPCNAGSYTNGTGKTTCTLCDVGSYQAGQGSTECTPCPPGSYTALPGRAFCSLCGAGTMSDAEGVTTCIACTPGSFSEAATSQGVTSCTLCYPGYYVNTPNQLACLQCPVGYFSAAQGAVTCDGCPPGTATSSAGSRDCSVCTPGRFSLVGGQDSCTACPAGTYSSGYGAQNCVPCDPGSAVPFTGSSQCAVCLPGQYAALEGRQDCTACPAGRYSTGYGSSDCVDCDEGWYQSSGGSSSCLPCSPGQYTSQTGRESCTLCAAGKFSNVLNGSTCVDCQRGFVQSQYGSSFCSACQPGNYAQLAAQQSCDVCPVGRYTNLTASTDCEPCSAGSFQTNTKETGCDLCPLGTYSGEGHAVCTPCDAGLVALSLGTTVCRPCSSGSIPDAYQTKCSCFVGYFSDSNHLCQPCPQGAECVQMGLERDTLPTADGYYLVDADSLSYQKCLSPKSCVGGQCVNHRTGILCGQCEPGYTMSDWSKDCVVCESGGIGWMVVTILILLILVGLLYLYMIKSAIATIPTTATPGSTHDPSPAHSIVEKEPESKTTFGLQDSQNHHSTASAQPLPSTLINGVGDNIFLHAHLTHEGTVPDRKHVTDNTYVMKIFVNFFQVLSSLTALPVAGAIAFPTYYIDFLSYFKFLRIDFIPWQNVSCLLPINFYTRMVVLCLVPIVFIITLGVVVGVTFLLDKKDMTDGDQAQLRRKHFRLIYARTSIFTGFMLYPLISSTVLSHFVCIQVGNISFLIADPTIMCYEHLWKQWTPFAAAMTLIYPIGIPTVFFLLLYSYRKTLDSPFALLGLGFLYESYTLRVWWFEILVMCQKLCLTSLLQFLPLAIQLPGGITVQACFLITLVLLQPELRLRNWTLHMLANVEVLLLLLIWHFSYKEGITSTSVSINACLSALFILLTTLLAAMLFKEVALSIRMAFIACLRKYRRRDDDKSPGRSMRSFSKPTHGDKSPTSPVRSIRSLSNVGRRPSSARPSSARPSILLDLHLNGRPIPLDIHLNGRPSNPLDIHPNDRVPRTGEVIHEIE